MTFFLLFSTGVVLFCGLISYLAFREGKFYKFQLILLIINILLPSFVNIVSFIIFYTTLSSLIPCDKKGGIYGIYAGLQGGGFLASIFVVSLMIAGFSRFSKDKRFKDLASSILHKPPVFVKENKHTVFSCPHCKERIAVSWLLFSSYQKKYVCSKCSASIAWTKKRLIISSISPMIVPAAMITSKIITGNYWGV